MGFNETPLLVKVSFIMTSVGFLFHLIGFASEYWQKYGRFHSGLWPNSSNLPSWFEATQAFETLGFIAAIVALVLIVLYIFVPQTSGKRIVFILGMVACFAAAGCIILGIIIYGSKVETNLSWSFALCTIAGIIFGVSGILLIVDMLKR
ncbi:uncharacterized protein LOC123540326 isoform X7 [Mercenaria mercenaria]|uniref:uncharacterized protein LOC123540326 isoform X7 n=1 Tax=Mercenaria mercenaria TaxID=6596 RepID=UPI00234F49CC|nr:uncharacterized protein LOC123540326 isoform X7 [Mercenaria mercenaria]XP_053382971.1 uncharacterized protein LOC123540326 isoform X7 [Mercenaria mercenaria]